MNALAEYVVSVQRGRLGPIESAMRTGLSGLSVAYRAGLAAYLLQFQIGLRRKQSLPCAVVSIGNLTVGGTGKTPCTQWLCARLRESGVRVAVLTRGYTGPAEHGCRIVSDTLDERLSPQEAGDEPYLLATTLPGVPVLAGKNRRRTGALACKSFAPDVIVLDDGFQYWQLARNLDIVLLDATRPFDNGFVLPRGLLRVPIHHLRRAGAIIITHASRLQSEDLASLKNVIDRVAPGTPTFTADLQPLAVTPLAGDCTFPLAWLHGKRIHAVSAIANPDSFEATISCAGGTIVSASRFADHHGFSPDDVSGFCADAERTGADVVLVTQKDAVKLARMNPRTPVFVLQVTLQLARAHELLDIVFGAMHRTSEPARCAAVQ